MVIDGARSAAPENVRVGGQTVAQVGAYVPVMAILWRAETRAVHDSIR